VEELCGQLRQVTRTEIRMESLVPCRPDCPRPLAEQGYFPEHIVLQAYAERRAELGCKGAECYEPLSVEVLHKGVVQGARGTPAADKLDEVLRSTEAMREELRQALTAAREQREIASASRQTLETGLAQIASALRDLVGTLDDPSRAGPCLYLIVPREPDFLKDRGAMFGRQFRLHLFCERLLKPVSFLRGTEDCGVFDFEMDREWWSRTAPYLRAAGRLLATLLPAARLLGAGPEAITKPLEEMESLAKGAQELLELDQAMVGPGVSEPAPEFAEEFRTAARRAESRSLIWLHDFLKVRCNTDDLSTASHLGLQRVKDKTTNRYLWVHHTQT
ncbi:MAG TPA: hypothetical protein PKE47_08845, partial [Verrucomicrobiota bacterium]|nr:hypothetical protein [Verrucomicrobiota bacterium]